MIIKYLFSITLIVGFASIGVPNLLKSRKTHENFGRRKVPPIPEPTDRSLA